METIWAVERARAKKLGLDESSEDAEQEVEGFSLGFSVLGFRV